MEDFQERIFHLRPEECPGPMKKGGGGRKSIPSKGNNKRRTSGPGRAYVEGPEDRPVWQEHNEQGYGEQEELSGRKCTHTESCRPYTGIRVI